jgi:hypothetical protein
VQQAVRHPREGGRHPASGHRQRVQPQEPKEHRKSVAVGRGMAMKPLQAITALIFILIQLPIWFYLIYKILQTINATELMWFLFWVYVPVTFVIAFLTRIVQGEKK